MRDTIGQAKCPGAFRAADIPDDFASSCSRHKHSFHARDQLSLTASRSDGIGLNEKGPRKGFVVLTAALMGNPLKRKRPDPKGPTVIASRYQQKLIRPGPRGARRRDVFAFYQSHLTRPFLAVLACLV